MARLIDADKLMEELDNIVYTRKSSDRHLLQIISAIQNAPTVDAVEVIRCKNCKKWERNTLVFTDCGTCSENTFGDYEGYLNVGTNEDYFCGLGERKDDV